jgi:prevent-host-death family protein
MTTVSIKEAKNRLSELGRKVEKGETIVVTRNGKPVFDLVPHPKKNYGTNWEAGEAFLKKHGVDRIASWISPDFDDPLPEDFLITPLPADFDKPKRRRRK